VSADDRKPPPLVDRRIAHAQRQAAAGKGIFAGQMPQGSGDANRHGMPKLPPGQRAVPNWPVLDLGDHPIVETNAWRLDVDGCVERPTTFDWASFHALPQSEDDSDFHCVTTWSHMDNRWRGVRFVDLMNAVGLTDDAGFVFVTAYDHDAGSGEPYTTNVTLEEALRPDVLLVHTWNGQPLPRDHGGPVRMITPQQYAWKGAKWIRRITLLAEERKGFWERRGYSNSAIPWFDDRFSR